VRGAAAPAPTDQFLLLSTSAFCLIHGIIARSFSPTSSIGCSAARRRNALKLGWPAVFFEHPFLGELAALDLAEDPLHLGPDMLVDDPGSRE